MAYGTARRRSMAQEKPTMSLDAMLELLEVRLFIIRPDAR